MKQTYSILEHNIWAKLEALITLQVQTVDVDKVKEKQNNVDAMAKEEDNQIQEITILLLCLRKT